MKTIKYKANVVQISFPQSTMTYKLETIVLKVNPKFKVNCL